jgi:aspartate racemase
MKTIGLIGGITWHSTLDYYRLINQQVNEKLGGSSSGKIILNSLNFELVKQKTLELNWEGLAVMMVEEVKKLENAGADCVLFCANTMHHIAPQVQAQTKLPLIHIAEATGNAIVKQHLSKVALLGTKYTMQLDFYKSSLLEKGIYTIIPDEADVELVNHAIYEEMSKGLFLPKTKTDFQRIIRDMGNQGAEAVVLGCTEIPILIQQSDVSIPVFDTTSIHVAAAVAFALESKRTVTDPAF